MLYTYLEHDCSHFQAQNATSFEYLTHILREVRILSSKFVGFHSNVLMVQVLFVKGVSKSAGIL